MERTNRYEWLRKEMAMIPRRKFFIFEPRSLSDLKEVEAQYGPLPPDYRDFVRDFGKGELFRSTRNSWYNLIVRAPPTIILPSCRQRQAARNVVQIVLGYYSNSGSAWIEWAEGSLLHEGAVFVGITGQRRKAAFSFEEWLKRMVVACKKLYSKQEWEQLLKPVAPFSKREQRILEEIPRFVVRKAGVTPDGNVLVEIENRSFIDLPCLTVGVRGKGDVTGAVSLLTAGISPGTSKTIEVSMYKGVRAFDPHQLELFRLPLPDPEDRSYYRELQEKTDGNQ